jgi:hypothetical protein
MLTNFLNLPGLSSYLSPLLTHDGTRYGQPIKRLCYRTGFTGLSLRSRPLAVAPLALLVSSAGVGARVGPGGIMIPVVRISYCWNFSLVSGIIWFTYLYSLADFRNPGN